MPSCVRAAATALIVITLLALSTRADGQYIFFDTDRDSIFTAADGIAPGDTTSVRVWLKTDRQRDRRQVNISCKPCRVGTCPSQMTLSGYKLELRAANGTLRWLDWKNSMPGMSVMMPFKSDSTKLLVAYKGSGRPPGTYHLGTVRVVPRSGTPSIAPVMWTAYATECWSRVSDGWMNFGLDWKDADTLKYLGIPNEPPIIKDIGAVSVLEADTLEFTITAEDDGPRPLRFYKGESPSYFTVETVDPGRTFHEPDRLQSLRATARVRITPGMCDVGKGQWKIGVTDGFATDETVLAVEIRSRPVKRDPNPLTYRGVSHDERNARTRRPTRGPAFLEGEWEWAQSLGWNSVGENLAVHKGTVEQLVFRRDGTYEASELGAGGRRPRVGGRYTLTVREGSSRDVLEIPGWNSWDPTVAIHAIGPDTLAITDDEPGVIDGGTHIYVRVPQGSEGDALNHPARTPSQDSRSLSLSRDMERVLRDFDRSFRPWDWRDAPAGSDPKGPGSPGVVIGDFDGDLRPDAALYGRGSDRVRLIVILSDHGWVRLVEVASTDDLSSGSAALKRPQGVLKLVPRGTNLGQCDGRIGHFNTDGLAIEVGSGNSYHYIYGQGTFREFVRMD
jgi:hypothetical protein